MLDPQQLYELTDPPELGRPVLIQALAGFVDAGASVRLVREHLLTSLESSVLARFDVDALIDYRSRRPVMHFVEDHWEDYDQPRLVLHLLRDSHSTPFLLLDGPEPDLRWDGFVAAVMDIGQRLGVGLTVGLNAIPMAVPHTRPVGLTAHGTRKELIAGYEPWLRRVRVPASAGHLLEYRLGRAGRDAVGFAVHVPHYLAQTDYPAAAELLLTSVSKATGLLLPTDELREAATRVRGEVDEQIAQSQEAARLVRALEQQYDDFVRERQSSNLLASVGPLPTAEELGAELERFLAEQGGHASAEPGGSADQGGPEGSWSAEGPRPTE